MFARVSTFLALILALIVASSARMDRHAHVRRGQATTGQCNTGDLQCCNNVMNATDMKGLLDTLSLSYDETDAVGIDCIPFNVPGVGEGAGCQQQPLCCSNESYNGFINVGCSPIDTN
ncbi:hydrophobin 2 [Chiua virens]|nr:hydrophobin 2 [Chiua virens]